MITLHRLGHDPQPFELNPDLIATIESHPDTVVTLTTDLRLLVVETPEQIVDAVRAWRVRILADALKRRP